MNFLNQQNKRHFALFQQDGAMEQREDKIHWIDSLLNIRSSKFNKNVSKISPRRGKKLNINEDFHLLMEMFDIVRDD